MANGSKALGVAMSEQDFDDVSTATMEVTTSATVSGNALIGNATTDLVAFHGSTPVDQSAAATSVSTTAPTASSPFGFVTTTQASDIVTALNTVITCLKEKGLMA